VDLVLDALKSYGPAGVVSIILWFMLKKSEERENKKDTRIQMLENQLIESYDERVLVADRVGDAIHLSANAAANAAKALDSLAMEVRASK
jgi:hypothetical protein